MIDDEYGFGWEEPIKETQEYCTCGFCSSNDCYFPMGYDMQAVHYTCGKKLNPETVKVFKNFYKTCK